MNSIKKFAVVGFSLLLLTGCTQVKEVDNQKMYEELQSDFADLEARLRDLRDSNQDLFDSLAMKYQGSVKMEVTILHKIEGSGDEDHMLIVNDVDYDHNTPIALVVENKETLNQFVVGDTYHIGVDLDISVAENGENVRYEFILVNPGGAS